MTKRILVVANRTAATHRLLEELRRRSPSEVALHVPPTRRSDWTAEEARDLIARATRKPVTLVDDTQGDYDEAILSAARGHRRLRRRIGAPVTEIAPRKPKLGMRETTQMAVQADAALLAEVPRDRWADLP